MIEPALRNVEETIKLKQWGIQESGSLTLISVGSTFPLYHLPFRSASHQIQLWIGLDSAIDSCRAQLGQIRPLWALSFHPAHLWLSFTLWVSANSLPGYVWALYYVLKHKMHSCSTVLHNNCPWKLPRACCECWLHRNDITPLLETPLWQPYLRYARYSRKIRNFFCSRYPRFQVLSFIFLANFLIFSRSAFCLKLLVNWYSSSRDRKQIFGWQKCNLVFEKRQTVSFLQVRWHQQCYMAPSAPIVFQHKWPCLKQAGGVAAYLN